MSEANKAAAIPPAKPALPTINRDPAWLLHRSKLSALFTLLHDYAEAARRALPDDIGGAV